MNNTTNNKRTYKTPEIEYVMMDSEISLQLQSNPPIPGNENTGALMKDNFDNEPYKMA